MTSSSCTGAYYQNVVPEADAWKLLEKSPDEARANGGWALMEEIHRGKNLVPISRFPLRHAVPSLPRAWQGNQQA